MRGLPLWLTLGMILLHLVLRVGMGLGSLAPDLFLVALLVAARLLSVGAAAGLGFLLGLLEDAFSLLSFGANAFSLAVVGILASRSRDLFVGDSLLFLFLYFALGKWIREFLAWMVSDPAVRASAPGQLLIEAPMAALYVAAVGIGVMFVLQGRTEVEG